MTPAEINEVLTSTMTTLGGPAQQVISEYTYYMAAQAWGLIAFGVFLGGVAWKAAQLQIAADEGDFPGWGILALLAIIFSVGFITCNVGDALAPRSAAIHQFIKDVR